MNKKTTIRRAFGPGRDRSVLFFVLVCYPPLSPRGLSAPAPGLLGPARAPTGSVRGSPASWFLLTVLAKINIFHFGADSEKMMIFHFLLRSPVILLLLRYLIFQKPLFRRLFPFGPPRGPKKKNDRSFLASLGPRVGPRPRSRDLLGGRFGRRTRSRDPLGTFQKPLGAKNEIVNISWVLPSKLKPRRTFADPGPPRKAPHGPDQFFGGPPRRLQGRSPENTKAPGRPRGRQTLVSEPSFFTPGNHKDAIYRKTCFFRKSLKHLFL